MAKRVRYAVLLGLAVGIGAAPFACRPFGSVGVAPNARDGSVDGHVDARGDAADGARPVGDGGAGAVDAEAVDAEAVDAEVCTPLDGSSPCRSMCPGALACCVASDGFSCKTEAEQCADLKLWCLNSFDCSGLGAGYVCCLQGGATVGSLGCGFQITPVSGATGNCTNNACPGGVLCDKDSACPGTQRCVNAFVANGGSSFDVRIGICSSTP